MYDILFWIRPDLNFSGAYSWYSPDVLQVMAFAADLTHGCDLTSRTLFQAIVNVGEEVFLLPTHAASIPCSDTEFVGVVPLSACLALRTRSF